MDGSTEVSANVELPCVQHHTGQQHNYYARLHPQSSLPLQHDRAGHHVTAAAGHRVATQHSGARAFSQW